MLSYFWPENKTEMNNVSTFKVIVLGNSFVGKSSLLYRFINKSFDDNFISTIEPDIFTHNVNDKVKIKFYDTAGQERFISMTTSFYRETKGVIFVYDVSSLESFNCINSWVRDVDRCSFTGGKNIIKVLVGNKCDLQERKVSEDMGRKLADEIDAKFIEASAKKNINVDGIFTTVVKDLIEISPTIDVGDMTTTLDTSDATDTLEAAKVIIVSSDSKTDSVDASWFC